MRPQEIYSLALSCGFAVKEQPDGTMDLNPYVYDFARAIISADHLGGCGPAMVNTLIRNRDSAEEKAAQYAAEAEQLGALASELHDTVQSLRAVLKEHGVHGAFDYQPSELPSLVNYKLRHAKKYVESARAENHQLKNSISSNAVLFAFEVITRAFEHESVESSEIIDIATMHGLTSKKTVTTSCGGLNCVCALEGFPNECWFFSDEIREMVKRISDKQQGAA